jgi:hypothetical protein
MPDTDTVMHRGRVVKRAITDANDLLAAGASVRTLDAVLRHGAAASDPPHLRLLAAPATVDRLFDDFLAASRAADLVAAVRTTDPPATGVLVTDRTVSVLVPAARRPDRATPPAADRDGPNDRPEDPVDGTVGLRTTDRETAAAVRSAHREAWVAADPVRPDGPPLSTVRDALESRFGRTVRSAFAELGAAVAPARGPDALLGGVTASLLAGARARLQFNDLAAWGSETGVGSPATFSRVRRRLEAAGVLDTDKVPIGVGRPRLRLRYATDRLTDAGTGETVAILRDRLADA